MTASAPDWAVIFDLDGVLVDTVELHYAGWVGLTRELGLPFDRALNDSLRGLGRPESLQRVLGAREAEFSTNRRQELLEQKNADFLARVARLTPADAAPGTLELLAELERNAVRKAVASSSRNARVVLEQLGLTPRFPVIVDGNDTPASKPRPDVYLLAAQRLRVDPQLCVAIEDAESGVSAALAAGMRVVGIGPQERLAAAHLVVGRLGDLRFEAIRRLAPE